ncbi:MAG: hypothetical protein EBR82_07230 [Caulobacteraceae bacterium]|nr:hypothetical protein [Caulobacteraceae bacterium]
MRNTGDRMPYGRPQPQQPQQRMYGQQRQPQPPYRQPQYGGYGGPQRQMQQPQRGYQPPPARPMSKYDDERPMPQPEQQQYRPMPQETRYQQRSWGMPPMVPQRGLGGYGGGYIGEETPMPMPMPQPIEEDIAGSEYRRQVEPTMGRY